MILANKSDPFYEIRVYSYAIRNYEEVKDRFQIRTLMLLWAFCDKNNLNPLVLKKKVLNIARLRNPKILSFFPYPNCQISIKNP